MAGLIQLALDFLGLSPAHSEGAPAPDTGAMPPSARRGPRGARPDVRMGSAPPRRLRQAPPAQPELDEQAVLPVHPQANRQALLLGRPVAYRLERGRRGTVGFIVNAQGLSVRAPGWLSLHRVDAAVVEKADWIVRKLADAGVRQIQQEAVRMVWADGSRFPLHGQPVVVRLGARRGQDGLREDAEAGVPALWLAVPADAAPEKIGVAVRAWMQREARIDFAARLDRYAASMGVHWTRLSLTDARTRWGSATVGGAIRLHWRLMHFRPEVIDYVVVHELAHLRHMDHSPRFWAVVQEALPNYQALRAELKSDDAPRW
ncbi:DUF45 domain-containing protein [Xylophilus rhododendri]|uniref:DUF45 domain-containing protein n=1 Tax=Xylophilus rhododendri TaxID=2697032 RepID=A0A857J898_9BURK|nr:SprT family zinc-dependent metalloprotease [Xylophilus rhododendri]QHI99279.1 DUF45 domain-containing protein [Xylophilus rhododendri]